MEDLKAMPITQQVSDLLKALKAHVAEELKAKNVTSVEYDVEAHFDVQVKFNTETGDVQLITKVSDSHFD